MINGQSALSARKRLGFDIVYFDPFFGYRRRPNAQIPLEVHRECGRLLNEVVLATEGRRGVSQPAKFVALTLDNWVMREFGEVDLSMEVLSELYCPGPRLIAAERVPVSMLMERLVRVKSVLAAHYPPGAALGELMMQLDRAITSLSKWDGKAKGKVYRVPTPGRAIQLRSQAQSRAFPHVEDMV